MSGTERWRLDDGEWLASDAVGPLLAERLARQARDTSLESDHDRWIGVVTNGDRAMVVLGHRTRDDSGHAIDPDASGEAGGYVLSNGQVDTYPNHDTVPWRQAVDVVQQIVAGGEPVLPAPYRWSTP